MHSNCHRGVFFQSVVEQYVHEISATLITLQPDDFMDLAQHFASSAKTNSFEDADTCMATFFERPISALKRASALVTKNKSHKTAAYNSGSRPSKDTPQGPLRSSKYHFPFNTLFEAVA